MIRAPFLQLAPVFAAFLLVAIFVPPSAAAEPSSFGAVAQDEESEKKEKEPAKEEPKSAIPEAPTLEFSDDAARAAFTKGWSVFHDSNWAEAEESFKLALGGVSKDDRSEVQSCLDACKGGEKLDDVVVLTGKGKWRKAYANLNKLYKKYEETPLYFFLEIQRMEIEGKLFHILEDYEKKTLTPDSNDVPGDVRKLIEQITGGQRYSNDPEFVREGKQSLVFKPRKQQLFGGQDPGVVFAKLDAELLAEYRWLHVSILAPTPKTGEIALLFDTAERANIRVIGQGDTAIEFHRAKPRARWNDIRIDLRSKSIRKIFAKQPADVYNLRIRMYPTVEHSVYVDRVRLEKE